VSKETNEGVPSWGWLNRKFMQSVGNMIALASFALPGLVLHVLHSQGQKFFDLVGQNFGSNQKEFVYLLLLVHVISAITSFLGDILMVVQCSAKLKSFQESGNHHEKKDFGSNG